MKQIAMILGLFILVMALFVSGCSTPEGTVDDAEVPAADAADDAEVPQLPAE